MEIRDPITEYAKTQRIVLLVDLNPLISLQNPRNRHRFLSSLLCSAKTLISFPQLSSSLFAFKLFFSSLSPLLSDSKTRSLIPNSPRSLSFDRPIPTFDSLSETLASVPRDGGESSGCDPRASCVLASMRQTVLDYAWETIIDDAETGTFLNCGTVVVRSNLVVMLSPICSSMSSLSEFLDVGIEDDCFGNSSALREKFRGFFANVNDAFVSRGIQFSWVDVRCEEMGKSELRFELLESGIKDLGWGFCSTDSIVFGSALVPFGLIYPKIGVLPNRFGCDDGSRKLHVQLGLEILDVDQKPLECNCCDLELVDLKLDLKQSSDNDGITSSRILGVDLKKKLWGCFGDGVNKLQVKALHKNTELSKFKGNLLDPLLVREVTPKLAKDQKESSDEFFADKVLGMIAREWGDSVPRKSAPIWQILLSFLYREGCCALVSVSDPNGDSIVGILKPFTLSSALLFLTNDVPENLQPMKQNDSNVKKSRRNKKLKLLQDKTWDSFCAAAFDNSELELEDVYFTKACNSNSKKMRFLKCWMKQIMKPDFLNVASQEKSESSQQEIQEVMDNRFIEQPISSASVGEDSSTSASKMHDTGATEFHSETSETFFNNILNKIQQGLESEAVDLGALAHRLVSSSIYWLSRNCGAQTSERIIPEPKSQDSSSSSLGAELVQLLLKDPKDFIAKGRSNDTNSQMREGSASEMIVREYELQILFRMEILQSDVGQSIGESMKQKFVKQICLLLEAIQCHLEGGFFGDWSFDDYLGKIIKSRYTETLKEVVHKIYKKMDLLLLYDDEDELPNHLFNSEEGNPSLKEMLVNDESHENPRTSESVTAEESLRSLENDSGTMGLSTQEDHARKLTQARERREQARRFTSFTSWPDLHRVWAPKQQQPKPTKPKSDCHGKMSKRKKRHPEEFDDSVCETPMTENKRSNSRHSNRSDDKEYSNQLSHSVSKSLFQDNND